MQVLAGVRRKVAHNAYSAQCVGNRWPCQLRQLGVPGSRVWHCVVAQVNRVDVHAYRMGGDGGCPLSVNS